jgi:hypothetical protein
MKQTFPEPEWCITQEALEPCSSFWYGGPSPFSLSGVFLRLLQYHFSTPDNIEEPLLKEYIWTPSDKGCISTGTPEEGSSAEESSAEGYVSRCPIVDEQGTSQYIQGSRLQIRPSWSQDASQVQQSPSLYVKREPFYTERVSFQDRSLPGLNQKGIYEGTEHQVNVIGSHSIICKGKYGGEADLIAQEVFFRMLHYQQVIKKDFKLGSLMTKSVSEIRQRKDEAVSTFYAVVRMEWAYVYRWRVIPESPILKRVGFEYPEEALP